MSAHPCVLRQHTGAGIEGGSGGVLRGTYRIHQNAFKRLISCKAPRRLTSSPNNWAHLVWLGGDGLLICMALSRGHLKMFLSLFPFQLDSPLSEGSLHSGRVLCQEFEIHSHWPQDCWFPMHVIDEYLDEDAKMCKIVGCEFEYCCACYSRRFCDLC